MLTPMLQQMKLSEILFDEVIYPRKDHDPALVQRYADTLEEIEARQHFIAVSTDNKLLDGKHRWLAYRKKYEWNGDVELPVFRYAVSTPHEQLKLSAELNSEHGWQLTSADKEYTAKALFGFGCTYDDIAGTLHVGKAQVSAWLARTVKDQRDRRNEKIFDLWLAFHNAGSNCGGGGV